MRPNARLLAMLATHVRTRLRGGHDSSSVSRRSAGCRAWFSRGPAVSAASPACPAICCTSRSTRRGSRNDGGGSGCGSCAETLLSRLTRQAILSSLFCAAWTPAPASVARVRSRPPSTSTATTPGVAATRTGTLLRLRPALRSRCPTSSAPTSPARVRTCCAEMGRPVCVRAQAASAKEPSRAASWTIRRRAAGE